MREYTVVVTCTTREVYSVTADSEKDAREGYLEGELIESENLSVDEIEVEVD